MRKESTISARFQLGNLSTKKYGCGLCIIVRNTWTVMIILISGVVMFIESANYVRKIITSYSPIKRQHSD